MMSPILLAACYPAPQMRHAEFPAWMDKTGVHAVGLLALDDGQRLTVEILEYDEELDELVVEVISSDQPGQKADLRQAIPVSRIVDFEPQLHTEQPWPHCDPCRNTKFSFARFLLMTLLFLSLIVGGISLFLLLNNTPYGMQKASAIVYTLAVVFLTFAATGRLHAYYFTCPAVRPKLPILLLRHLSFLVLLFILQTAAIAVHPSLPDWWNVKDRKGSTPFELVLILLSFALGAAQVLMNRKLLDRAHREFSS